MNDDRFSSDTRTLRADNLGSTALRNTPPLKSSATPDNIDKPSAFSFCLLYDAVTIWMTQGWMIGWFMNWKGSGRKWMWPNQGTILAFACRDHGNPWITHLLNTSVEHSPYTNLFGRWSVTVFAGTFWDDIMQWCASVPAVPNMVSVSPKQVKVKIWGSHSSGYEECHLLGYNAV
jgi:hypothetical protein